MWLNLLICVVCVLYPAEARHQAVLRQRLTFKPATHNLSHSSNLPACEVVVNETSAKSLQHSFEIWQPNFARLELKFNGHLVQHVPEVILPFHWVWTYYSNNALFSYLKWPMDFHILSLGLLDAKTLPDGHFLILGLLNSSKCSLTIGDKRSTMKIAEALKHFTEKYISPTRKGEPIDYSYWCYHAEVPNTQDTLAHKLRIYTGYPMEIAAYNCCHTSIDKLNKSRWHVNCEMKQVHQIIEGSVIPYFMSILAFAYFPIALLQASSAFVATKVHTRAQYQRILQENASETNDGYVYLNGFPPISLTKLVSGFCGLVNRFPVVVSRFRRLLFVALAPCIIIIRIYVYKSNIYTMVMALLKHKCPLGFVSMIGGFERSRHVFLTALGGPCILLGAFYVLGIFLLVIPENIDNIFEVGANRDFTHSEISPLLFNLKLMERFSRTNIMDKSGYAKAASICSGGVFMLINPAFWWFVIKLQLSRIRVLFGYLCMRCENVWGTMVTAFFLPVVVVLNTFEIFLTIFLYGLPVINGICIVVRGYTLSLMKLFKTSTLMTRLIKRTCIKLLIVVFLCVCFIYYVFSFCTIFTETFMFLSKVLIFCFLSVIVYPSTSFGYLFFGIVFVYYVIKTVTGFGEAYIELLADAVEVSCQLDDDPCRVQLMDGTLIVDDIDSTTINKLQINGNVLILSSAQRQSVQARPYNKTTNVKHKDHMVGIPRELFLELVNKYRPVHVCISLAVLKIGLIVCLIAITFSVISRRPFGSSEGISEVMHVVFLMGIGALPKILEVALDNMNHSIRRDIQLRKMKTDIVKYWQEKLINENSLDLFA